MGLQITIFFNFHQQMMDMDSYIWFSSKNLSSLNYKIEPQFLTFNLSEPLTFIVFSFHGPLNFVTIIVFSFSILCKLCGWHFSKRYVFLWSTAKSDHLTKFNSVILLLLLLFPSLEILIFIGYLLKSKYQLMFKIVQFAFETLFLTTLCHYLK